MLSVLLRYTDYDCPAPLVSSNEKLYFLSLSENITFISMFIISDNVLCILFKFPSINVRKFTSQTN